LAPDGGLDTMEAGRVRAGGTMGEAERTEATALGWENPAVAALRERGARFSFAPEVVVARDLPDFAARSGLRPRQVVKSLLLDLDGRGHALLVVAGDRSANFAALRRHFGVRSVRLADPETVKDVTGYRIGTVTPLALRDGELPILVDDALVAEPLVSLGTGVPGHHVRLAGADLPAAVGGTPGPFGK
jgi:prolyl-tRNA editing enzyme YbaK/EbsC (Cys-tRNA(Pro) deacylase)